MMALRIPLGVWDWKGTALVLVLLLAPLLAALSLTPDGDVSTSVTTARGLLVGLATLAASVFLYLHWRVTASQVSGWLATLLAVAAAAGLALAAFTLTHGDDVDRQHAWVGAFRAVIVLGLLVAARVSARVRVSRDPLAAGLLVGLSVALVRQVVLTQAPPLPDPPAVRIASAAVLAAATVGLVVVGTRLPGLPGWVRSRVGAGVVLLGVGSAVGGLVALATGLAGAVLLAGTAATVLHRAIDAEKREVTALNDRLHQVELGIREDRARLHEIDATVAGIASAQRLIHEGSAAERGDALAAMMRAEVERLARLVAERAPVRRRSVDLDDVVGQIVLAHRARGRTVTWQPTGTRALGGADDIAEIVNVLLENAAVHGGARGTRVSVDTGESEVVLTVSDRGPGVPPELRERLFDWGVRSPDSPGQGIGLHIAAEVAHQMGGRLELRPSLAGATFSLHLPLAPRGVISSDHVAHAN